MITANRISISNRLKGNFERRKLITTSLPPRRNIDSAWGKTDSISSSSLFRCMRMAWNVRVAGCL